MMISINEHKHGLVHHLNVNNISAIIPQENELLVELSHGSSKSLTFSVENFRIVGIISQYDNILDHLN